MPLWQCLLLLALACAIFRAWSPAVAATTLLANWGICTVTSSALGYQFHYMLLAAVDLTTAAFLLILPPSRAQVLLCLTYVIALCCHAYFGFVGESGASEYYYWWAMHYVAWSQFWITALWGMYDAGRWLIGRGTTRGGVDAGGHLLHPLAGIDMHGGQEP